MVVVYSNGERKDIGGFNSEAGRRVDMERREAQGRYITRAPLDLCLSRVPVALIVEPLEFYGIKGEIDRNRRPGVTEQTMYRGLPVIVTEYHHG